MGILFAKEIRTHAAADLTRHFSAGVGRSDDKYIYCNIACALVGFS